MATPPTHQDGHLAIPALPRVPLQGDPHSEPAPLGARLLPAPAHARRRGVSVSGGVVVVNTVTTIAFRGRNVDHYVAEVSS